MWAVDSRLRGNDGLGRGNDRVGIWKRRYKRRNSSAEYSLFCTVNSTEMADNGERGDDVRYTGRLDDGG